MSPSIGRRSALALRVSKSASTPPLPPPALGVPWPSSNLSNGTGPGVGGDWSRGVGLEGISVFQKNLSAHSVPSLVLGFGDPNGSDRAFILKGVSLVL